MPSIGFLFTVVLYGYSPAPKYADRMPVKTSNSEFAVPAPSAGIVRYPDGNFSFNLVKFGTGSSESVNPFTTLGSKNDSNCTQIILGVFFFDVSASSSSLFSLFRKWSIVVSS